MQNNRFDNFKYKSYILLYADGSCIYSNSFDVDSSDEGEEKILCVWGFENELSPKDVMSNIPYLVASYMSRYVD